MILLLLLYMILDTGVYEHLVIDLGQSLPLASMVADCRQRGYDSNAVPCTTHIVFASRPVRDLSPLKVVVKEEDAEEDDSLADDPGRGEPDVCSLASIACHLVMLSCRLPCAIIVVFGCCSRMPFVATERCKEYLRTTTQTETRARFSDACTRAYTQTAPFLFFIFQFTQIRDDCVLRARGNNTPQTTAAL